MTLRLPGGTNVNRMLTYDKANRLKAAMEDGGVLSAVRPFVQRGIRGGSAKRSRTTSGETGRVMERGLGSNPVNIGDFQSHCRRRLGIRWSGQYSSGSVQYRFDSQRQVSVRCRGSPAGGLPVRGGIGAVQQRHAGSGTRTVWSKYSCRSIENWILCGFSRNRSLILL